MLSFVLSEGESSMLAHARVHSRIFPWSVFSPSVNELFAQESGDQPMIMISQSKSLPLCNNK